jgi:hypothetical protein
MIPSRFVPLFAFAAFASHATAFVWTFNDPMDGLQETPPNASPATGTIVGTYDDVTNFLDVTVTFQGLLGMQTDAHIHKAPPGIAGPVVFGIPLGSPSVVQRTITELQEADLLAGLWYVNIHTTMWPAGEIRGQMNPVPEPATMLALAAGLGVLARRRAARADKPSA